MRNLSVRSAVHAAIVAVQHRAGDVGSVLGGKPISGQIRRRCASTQTSLVNAKGRSRALAPFRQSNPHAWKTWSTALWTGRWLDAPICRVTGPGALAGVEKPSKIRCGAEPGRADGAREPSRRRCIGQYAPPAFRRKVATLRHEIAGCVKGEKIWPPLFRKQTGAPSIPYMPCC